MEIQNLMSASIIVGAATATKPITAPAPEKAVEKNAVESEGNKNASVTAEAPETQSLAMEANSAAQEQNGADQEQKDKQQGKMDEESVNTLTKELNELMENINCDLEFKYHKEVDVMTVKMVDKKTDEVLREYPPEEMVENMIKAREWLGAFLDREA